MRFFKPLLFVILAAFGSIGLFALSGAGSALLPKAGFCNGTTPLDGYNRLENSTLTLTVWADPGSWPADATLHLFGAPVETINLESKECKDIKGSESDAGSKNKKNQFSAVSLAPGRNEARIRIRRNLGPFELTRWHSISFDVIAKHADIVLEAPERVWNGRVKIHGSAPPRRQVKIQVNGEASDTLAPSWGGNGSALSKTAYSGNNGRFSTIVELPNPGRYELTASTSSAGNGADLVSMPRTVTFEAQLPLLRERALIVFIDEDGIRYQTIAVFEEGDPRAEAVLRGDLSEKAFQHAVHGKVLINRIFYDEMRGGKTKSKKRHGKIEIRQEIPGIPRWAIDEGPVEISRRIENLPPAIKDRIEVRLKDTGAYSATPVPGSVKENIVVWSSKDGPVPGLVTVGVRFPENSLEPWSLSAGDVLPGWLSGLFFDLVAMLPMLWFLRVLAQTNTAAPASVSLRGSILSLGVFISFSAMSFMPRELGEALAVAAAAVLGHGTIKNLTEIGGLRPHEWVRLSGFALTLIGFLLWQRLNPRVGWAAAGNDVRTILFVSLLWGLTYNVATALAGRMRELTVANEKILTALLWATAFAVCVGIAVLVIRKLLQTGRLVSGYTGTVPAGIILLAAAALLLLARPAGLAYDPLFEWYSTPAFNATFAVASFINQIGSVAPLLAAMLICAFLANGATTLPPGTYLTIATILFAGVLVGTGRVWLIFPVPFLLALVIFPRFVLLDGQRRALFATHQNAILMNRQTILATEYTHARGFAAPFSWFGLGLFGVHPDDKERKRKYVPLKATFPSGEQVPLPELGFAFGRSGAAFDNARASLRVGFWGALFFVVIYAVPSFSQTNAGDQFPYLDALQRVISVGGYWLVAAFFFGYFYDRIRGSSGWKKGAILGLGIVLAREPLALLSASGVADYSAIAIQMFQTIAFFVLLGLITFDMHAFRSAAGPNADWRAFPLLAGLSVVEAIATIALAGIGVAISSAFGGQLTDVLGQVAAELIQAPADPRLPGQPR